MSGRPARLAKGLWRWTARHPEWHPEGFGSEVASFALATPEATLLVDPLLPADPAPALELVERIGAERVAVLVTIPLHVRSAEELRDRFARVTIHGHPACARRLHNTRGFEPIELGRPLPGGALAFAVGSPRRQETPLLLPSHRALVFGDAVAEQKGRLRVWAMEPVDERVERFYRERFNPTLKPLLELDFERVLVTHGEPVMKEGRRALRSALRSKPWYHR